MRSSLPPPAHVEEYLARFPAGVRRQLSAVRRIIRTAAPDAVETMAYGMPTYRLGVNLVHFAGFPGHIGLYPTPSAIQAFQAEFAGSVSGKGSVQFPLNQPLPWDLIERVVQFRVAEVRAARGRSGSSPTKSSRATPSRTKPATPKSQSVKTQSVKTPSVKTGAGQARGTSGRLTAQPADQAPTTTAPAATPKPPPSPPGRPKPRTAELPNRRKRPRTA